MSVIEYIEQKIFENAMQFEDLHEIELEPALYKQFLLEVSSMLKPNTRKQQMFSQKLYYNSIVGPIEIKRKENDVQDPNNIFKEIL